MCVYLLNLYDTDSWAMHGPLWCCPWPDSDAFMLSSLVCTALASHLHSFTMLHLLYTCDCGSAQKPVPYCFLSSCFYISPFYLQTCCVTAMMCWQWPSGLMASSWLPLHSMVTSTCGTHWRPLSWYVIHISHIH